MFTPEQINLLLKQISSQLGMMNSDIVRKTDSCDGNESGSWSSNSGTNGGGTGNSKPVILTPSTALVTAGLLTGALIVDSVLVDRNQTIQIVLEGSLKIEKKEKTKMDMILEEVGSMPFDQVMKALLDRFT